MFINARDNETMPVMNDEVPDEGDYDAGRGRGEFDNITPEDFIHGGGSGHGNPPGWLGPADINRARHQMPIAYVEIVPVRTDEMGRISQVGSLLRVAEDGSIERTLITGRVLYHETLREAIARNVAKDLGDIALPLLPVGLQPFTVAEFFPTPGLSEYYDPARHRTVLRGAHRRRLQATGRDAGCGMGGSQERRNEHVRDADGQRPRAHRAAGVGLGRNLTVVLLPAGGDGAWRRRAVRVETAPSRLSRQLRQWGVNVKE